MAFPLSSSYPTAFSRPLASPIRPVAPITQPDLSNNSAQQDQFLNPKYNVSSGQALGFFLGGFLLTLAGRSIIRSFMQEKPAFLSKTLDSKNIDASKVESHKFQVYQNYNDPLSNIYRLIHFDPKQGNALLTYAAVSVMGYLSGSVVQGGKESWVRQQETKIRAHLINKLQGVVRQSIQTKTEFNNQFKETVRNRISTLLTEQGVPNPSDFTQDVPIIEPLRMQQRYFYEPTHRTLQFGSAPVENSPLFLPPPESTPAFIHWQKALIFGVGTFSGFVLNGFLRLMTHEKPQNQSEEMAEHSEGIMLKDKESWSIMGVKNRRNFAVMAGFFGMSAAAALGKTLVDGLREIEVTRLNARTELDYQTHNWLTQDPMFHNIAEQETVENDLRKLEKDLPCLRFNPPVLQQRIQAILSNIGRNSAPPYYPMTPTVGLVEARA